ncbi:MAG: hypothetical protein QOK31_257, partial [Solirubrobacteraceae bacterium]|nr:hypothetical protein [Solirubrobacteraceae bacterium]
GVRTGSASWRPGEAGHEVTARALAALRAPGEPPLS